jgi:uncharacterized protein (TIGR02646 family)
VIRLYRDKVPEPEVLRSEKIESEKSALAAFYSRPEQERSQQSFKTRPWFLKDCQEPLMALSNGKCAYCETPMSTGSVGDVDSYRPRSRALGLDGKSSSDHYWWLTYEWSNMLPSCTACNALKGKRFPVQRERASVGSLGTALLNESPLLLDPCADEPAEHLIFSEDGLVAGTTEKGRITVEVVGLNRTDLVGLRCDSLSMLKEELQLAVKGNRYKQSDVAALIADEKPFVSARRQFAERFLEELAATPIRSRGQKTGAEPAIGPSLKSAQPAEIEEHFSKFQAEQVRQESYSIDSEEAKEDYFIKTRLIEKIEIENFKPIENLTLRFPTGVPSSVDAINEPMLEYEAGYHVPWLMLLGENATGKSSVLQAVALCLLGNEWRQRIGLDASDFVRDGATRGSVRVFLTGTSTPITLEFSQGTRSFKSSPGEPKVLLLGYGSTRLLPRPGLSIEGNYKFAQTDNLFNPFVALGDAGLWLAQLGDSLFETVARALKTLLQLGEEDQLVRRAENGTRVVYAKLMGTEVTLNELSDGYQSVLALTCDVMRVMLSRWDSMEAAEGLVILDEIGSHLHPRWRMKVVESMRKTFPRVQFLVSTHDPLCLRGLNDGEVAIMRRDHTHRVTAITENLPRLRGLRVDQILTSEFFGLSSTIDPDLEKLFEEYYGLLAKPEPTAEEALRIAELRGSLDKYRVLGTNRRERMMLDTIDHYLAVEPDISDEEFRTRTSTSVKSYLREVWNAQTPSETAPPTWMNEVRSQTQEPA